MIKFIILLVIFFIISNVRCVCYLQIPDNKENAPVWEKRVGKRWFKVPYIANRLKLLEGEVVSGYCKTKLRSISYTVYVPTKCEPNDDYCANHRSRKEKRYVQERNITVQCVDGSLVYKSDILSQIIMSCNNFEWKVNVQPMGIGFGIVNVKSHFKHFHP